MLIKLWTVAVGNTQGPFSLPSTKRKAKAAVDLIKQQEGFVGVNPQPPLGTLLLFRTENNAKRARNVLRAAGVVCGTMHRPTAINRIVKEENNDGN